MLFKIHSDLAKEDKFFEMNEGAMAIEEFGRCTSKQMFFVCLVADRDYDSPLRSLPEKARREKAAQIAGYGMEGTRPDKNARNLVAGKVPSVERAIQKYREIQYDEDREMHGALDKQIKEAIETISADKEEKAKIVKTTKNRDGETIKEEYIDAKMTIALRAEAIKLAQSLPDLREARAKLHQTLPIESPLENITTHTSQDLIGFDDNEEGSTLDLYMERLKKQQ